MSGSALIVGTGMHPWGKWGRSFVEYGVVAARAALQDAGLEWGDVDLVVGGDTVRNGYPGYVAGGTFARALGFQGARTISVYAACATGAAALQVARANILAGISRVALVIGADTTPKGFLAPNAGARTDDPDWLRFRLLGATNPTYFGLWARRRMALYGDTADDFAAVRVKNARHGSANEYARYRAELTADDVAASAIVADPLHLLEICATSDGAAALIVCSADFAAERGLAGVHVRAVSTTTPVFPDPELDLPNFATDSWNAVQPAEGSFRDRIITDAYEEAGIGPEDVSVAEVYDLSSALELDWYESLQLCPPGEGAALLRSGATTIGGRVPVNTSGGLASFGEAVPAQAIAQVCELVDQLRGRSGSRQVSGARVGISANRGLFGHGSSVVVST